MSDVIIRGAAGILTGLSGPLERTSGDIRVRDGKISAIGAVTPAPADTVIEADGCVIYPGLISTHHHLFQSVLKGVQAGIDLPLEGWLRTVPYSYWHKLDEDALEVAATVGLAELLLSGTTTIADHHYLFTEDYGFDPAAVIFEVAERLGIRLVLCRGGATQGRAFDIPHTQPMPYEPLDLMIRQVGDLAARFNDPAPDSMRRVVFAPTTPPWSVKPDELDVIADAARAMKLRMHSHLSETHVYVDFCLENFGKRPVQWVAEHQWLGSDIWFAHLVHLDDSELRLLAETGTGMAHCPQSNCRLGSGVAAADRLAQLGGRVSLAVDGAASNESCDMINEMHCAWQVHRAVKGAQALRAEEVLRWATAGGADVLDLPAIGTVEVGKAADLAIFDLAQPRYAGLHDPLIGPIVSGGSAHLRHLLVGGRPVVIDGAIPGLDLAALSRRAAGVVRRLAA
ncbi:amidohydrolase family protein [Telmatospirillum sp.]|uniref:amidohydrolase family protein n=1 Tax=Telmatospirillum sp. TaxID=2079197 RepID=UPI002849C3A1|nr:amidohydrolase family protein [Telmatospirillum sp.]MDR3437298.1 amidohydrolase family protein [Telmatospirillum sp.]